MLRSIVQFLLTCNSNMDNYLSTIIKKEKENIYEKEDNDFIKLSFDIGIKVESDHDIDDWCPQKILSDCKANIYLKSEKDDLRTCVVCHKYFQDSHSLYKHNLIHLIVPLIKYKFFMCDICPKFYTKKKFLKNHTIKEHQLEKQHKRVIGVTKSRQTCQICTKTFSYKSFFQHMKTVHKDDIWKCEACGAVFKCESYLKRHIKSIHTGQKWCNDSRIWECQKCPSTFKSRSERTKHLNTCHSTEEVYCKICNSKLKCKKYLRYHMRRVHCDDGTVHSCDICGKIFKSPIYVRVHMKNKHGSKALKK